MKKSPGLGEKYWATKNGDTFIPPGRGGGLIRDDLHKKKMDFKILIFHETWLSYFPAREDSQLNILHLKKSS